MALDESNISTDDEGSPPLLLETDDVAFQVVAAGRRQQVTTCQNASPALAETSPPTTGNSFGALADTDNSSPQARDAPDKQAAVSDEALFKTVHASLPDVVATLFRHQTEVATGLTSLIAMFKESMKDLKNAMMKEMDNSRKEMMTEMKAMEDRLLAKINAFNGQFGDLCQDVNDHEKRLTNLSSDVHKQEPLLKGYKDNKDKLVSTLRTDVNNACAKIPALQREIQDSTVGLVRSIKEIEAIVQDLRMQVATLPPVDQGAAALAPSQLRGVSVDPPPTPGTTHLQLPGGLMPAV